MIPAMPKLIKVNTHTQWMFAFALRNAINFLFPNLSVFFFCRFSCVVWLYTGSCTTTNSETGCAARRVRREGPYMHIWRIICITIIIIINFYPDIKIHTQNRTHEMKSHQTQNEAVNVNMQAKRNKFSRSHSLSTWPSLPKYCINNKCCCCCFFLLLLQILLFSRLSIVSSSPFFVVAAACDSNRIRYGIYLQCRYMCGNYIRSVFPFSFIGLLNYILLLFLLLLLLCCRKTDSSFQIQNDFVRSVWSFAWCCCC